MEETKKRPFPTPALPSSPTRNVKLNPRVGVLTGQPRDNTAPPEVESSDPEDNQTEEQTEEDEEEDEEADMPQSGLLAKVQRKDSLARHLEDKEKKARRPLPLGRPLLPTVEHPAGTDYAF
jgi:hypothetical protein